ncbi:MAG TPA: type II toxin-antitoxin system VapC family toxin [Anaerolineales bacterium]|nr:type II toxin-antitoxin system VapC family toxin [Anaerolineales bacterium]HLO33509.1 type II toxin-antitoxin system VapC family toxin [Anaerolineales bacterium]
MKLIDTDIAIDHFHGNQSAREFFAQALASGEPLYISVVTLTELLAGMRPGEEELTKKLLSLFTVIDVDNTIGRKVAEYLCQFSRSHKMELGDALIAATASAMGAELATRNIKHYPMNDIRITAPYGRGRK